MPGVNPLLRPLDRLVTRNAEYEMRLTKIYINEPHRIRGLFWRGMVGFVWGIVLIMGMNFVPRESFWFTFCSVCVGWLLGRGAMRQFARARAYRDGWLAGRMQMIISMKESHERGMSPDEWLEGEMERDMSVMRWL